MAKFKRFDPRNKKAGTHKKRTKFGDIDKVDKKRRKLKST
jgi:hypothetical protein